MIKQLDNTRPVMAAMGKALEQELIATFRDYNQSKPNKMGWPRSNFWNRRVARKTALTSVTQSEAVVTVASPELIHRIEGGTVTPKRGKTLAIPPNGQAYKLGGPRASGRDFQFLLLAQGNLVGALLKPEQYRTKDRQMIGGEVMYWLVRKVTHKPDPSLDPYKNPSIAARIKARLKAVLDYTVDRLIHR